MFHFLYWYYFFFHIFCLKDVCFTHECIYHLYSGRVSFYFIFYFLYVMVNKQLGLNELRISFTFFYALYPQTLHHSLPHHTPIHSILWCHSEGQFFNVVMRVFTPSPSRVIIITRNSLLRLTQPPQRSMTQWITMKIAETLGSQYIAICTSICMSIFPFLMVLSVYLSVIVTLIYWHSYVPIIF